MTETKEVKIGDFGISFQRKKGEVNTLFQGTIKYMAPEMFDRTGYDSKIDVYALGVTFHLMCYFCIPRDIVIVNDALGQRGVFQETDPRNFRIIIFIQTKLKI